MDQQPKHGDERNRGTKTEVWYMETNFGRLQAGSTTYPTLEMYCGHCEKWVNVQGLINQIITPCCNESWI